jgi:hypothetical protein
MCETPIEQMTLPTRLQELESLKDPSCPKDYDPSWVHMHPAEQLIWLKWPLSVGFQDELH